MLHSQSWVRVASLTPLIFTSCRASSPTFARQAQLSCPSHSRNHSSAAGDDPKDRVFEHNRRWVANQLQTHGDAYFANLSEGQSPAYLWIGCSDSRVPVEQLAGFGPGDAFVHRNIANLVPGGDLSSTSVLEYAIAHLRVRHIVVAGHYGCGGVQAALAPRDMGALNPWLRNIRDVYRLHAAELDAIANSGERCRRLVELNVLEQCRNVMATAVFQQAFAKHRFPTVHGWVYGLKDGLLRDLKFDFAGTVKDMKRIYDLTGGHSQQ